MKAYPMDLQGNNIRLKRKGWLNYLLYDVIIMNEDGTETNLGTCKVTFKKEKKKCKEPDKCDCIDIPYAEELQAKYEHKEEFFRKLPKVNKLLREKLV